MTEKQQRLFIDKTVESIVIDMDFKIIKQIIYFNED